jgi:hypothetical protein
MAHSFSMQSGTVSTILPRSTTPIACALCHLFTGDERISTAVATDGFLGRWTRLTGSCASAWRGWSTRFTVCSIFHLMEPMCYCTVCVRIREANRAGVPQTHKREIQAIFPDKDVKDMLIVPTCQKTAVDLVNRGEIVENEKDHCLERFVKWAQVVCDELSSAGYWVDYIDPCSGLPVRCRCPPAKQSCVQVQHQQILTAP